MGHHRLKAAAGASPADPYFSSTSLLLLGNGTNGGQNNTFVDSSTNNFTVTRNGNTTQGSFSPFSPLAEYSTSSNGGSGYFDGSGDYLELPSNSAFAFGTGDFTIEGWVYRSDSNIRGIFQLCDTAGGLSGSNNLGLSIGSDVGQVWRIYANSTAYNSTATWSTSTWYHFALVKTSGTIKLYINGTLVISQSDSSTYSGTFLCVGGFYSTAYLMNGYISSLRILKGTAQYTATFTPPTSPLTAITNTSLLLNFTNASILDSTAKNDLETVGDAQISTSVKKFGTGSIYFDGTGDTLSVPPSANLSIGTGNFTLEGWIYPTSFASVRALISFANNNVFYFNTSGIPYYGIFGVSDTALGTTAVTTSVWTHVAFVRNGSTLTCYLNGSSVGSTTTSSSIGNSTDASFVGSHRSANYWIGYIDDLRITKGVARYTSNFTPPAAQLPAR